MDTTAQQPVMVPGRAWQPAEFASRAETTFFNLTFRKVVIEGGGRRDIEGLEAAFSFHPLLLNISNRADFPSCLCTT